MRDFTAEFQDIVHGQLPATAERIKSALDDSEVQAAFERIEEQYDQNYLYFLNMLAQKYGLDMDQGEDMYQRLARRRQTADG